MKNQETSVPWYSAVLYKKSCQVELRRFLKLKTTFEFVFALFKLRADQVEHRLPCLTA